MSPIAIVRKLLKGKLGNFFLLAQRFYWAQTKRSLNRQFWPKSPKVGQKTGQSVKNWPNKTPFAFNLLWESTNSVIGAAVGIHQFLHPTCCGNPLFGNLSIQPTVGIQQFYHRSYCGNPCVYIIQSDRCISIIITTISGHLLIKPFPLESHVVAICLRVQFTNFGH